jgi:hypothetical protein
LGLKACAYLSMLVASFAAYGPTLSHEFVWDDLEQVRDNPIIRDTGNFWEFWHRDILDLSRQGGNHFSNYYRPLFYVQYLFYYQMFELDTRLWHAAAIVVHALASMVAIWLARRLGFSLGVAWLTGLLFALHPAHGESVSWVAAAFNDPPAAIFLMLALGAHIGWARDGKYWCLPLAALGFAAALCTKESGLSMLLLAPLVAWYVRRDESEAIWRGLLRTATDVMPFAVAMMIFVGVEVATFDHTAKSRTGLAGYIHGHPHAWYPGLAAGLTALLAAGFAVIYGVTRNPRLAWDDTVPSPAWLNRFLDFAPYFVVTLAYFYVRKITLSAMLGVYPDTTPSMASVLPTLPYLAVFYCRLLVWPLGYAPSYGVRYATGWSDPHCWASILGLITIAALVILLARRRRNVTFGALWFLCCVWPVFNIRSFVPYYLVHQRYLYLAVFGFCLVLAWLIVTRLRAPALRIGVAALLCVVWGASNLIYNPAWSTDVALWTRINEADPRNPSGFVWLANRKSKELKDQRARTGRSPTAEELSALQRLYEQAVAANADDAQGAAGMASFQHVLKRDLAAAVPFYESALAVYARSAGDQHEAWANCQINYGACLAELGRRQDAIREFLQAANRAPFLPDAASNAALLLLQDGRAEQAERVLLSGIARRDAFLAMVGRAPNANDAKLRATIAEFYRLTQRPDRAAEFQAQYERMMRSMGTGEKAS